MYEPFRYLSFTLALLIASPGFSTDLVEDGCGFVWKVNGGEPELVEVPNLNILEASRTQESLTFEVDPEIEIESVVCWRNTIIPAENDYKVPEAGFSFYLKMSDETESRTTVLEKTSVGYRLRLIDGDSFSDDEREQVVEKIRHFNLSTGKD